MQRIILWGVGFFVALGAALGAYLYVSLIPFFHEIGIAMTVLVYIGLVCAAALLVAFTWMTIGRWSNQRNVIQVGEVVSYRDVPNKQWVHLSSIHEQAKLPLQIAGPQVVEEEGEPDISEELICHLYDQEGITLQQVAKALHTSYSNVQTVTSRAKKNGRVWKNH